MDQVKQPKPKARFGARAKPANGGGSVRSLDEGSNGLGEHEDGTMTMEEEQLHLLPKVMAPYETKPGCTPRRVQIQRKRKLFAQQDLPQLIQQEGLQENGQSVFKLDIFDDTDYESRLCSQWVPKTPGVAPTPAKAALAGPDGVKSWKDCRVIDYDEGRNRYAVAYRDAPSSESSSVRWVDRVDLCFSAEDPFVFARRHVDAHANRGRAESLLRYNLYIDCMPTEDIPPLSTEQVNRILGFALNSKKLRDKLMDTNALLAEVNTEYARSMNKITFDNTLRRGQSGCLAALVPIAEAFPLERRVKTRYKGCVPVAEYDFAQQFSDFSFRTLLTKSEVISALTRVRVECAKALKMSLFNTHFTKSLRLEEFEQGQMQTTDQTANYLKDSWVVTLKNAIKSSFKDVGKGWFNLHETNMETYEFSKLKKFLTQTKFIMEDTLRFLVEDSLHRLVAFVRIACLHRATVKSTACVEVEVPAIDNQPAYVINGNSSTINTASIRKPPLLLLELQATKDGTRFQYSTSLDAIIPRFCAVYDNSLNKVSGIPVIEPAVMEELFWAIVPQLRAVHPLEEWVVKGREELVARITAALVPVREYLALYDTFEPLLRLSPESYVAALEAKGEELALAEVKAEIKKHSQELAALYDALPSGMAVGGLVYVNTQKVREVLLKKKEKLVALLRSLCARIPRKMMSVVSSKFSEIERVLRQKPEKLEDVHEQRKFIDGLPQAIGTLMQDIESTRPWYEYLELQKYGLTDEEAKDKFLGVSWPAKLQRLADRQLTALEDDESRFREDMFQEQDGFQDSLGELSALVNNSAQNVDLSKMDTVVQEVKRLDERLRKADADAQLYNAREGLLGLPITDYSHANYKSWMNDSWEKLDGEQVESSVTGALKVLFKTGKVLQQRGLEKFAANCEAMRQEVEGFKRMVPLVLAIRNPGMRQRHWETISKDIGMPLYPDKKFTLVKAEEMGLLNHLTAISKVSEVAGKEYSIEQALDKMVSEWDGAELQVMDYRETGTYIIKVDDAISQMLDDHIVMTQSMSFSQFKKPFEERISKWELQLSLASDILEQWVALQRQWMYLEPIFSSEDIMQQLPLEAKRFATVDRIWRKTLEGAKRNPHVLKVCGNQKLLDQFTEGNKLLESVQKGLADYLETKRLAFARFFFLSNDELLQILSQTKNPLAVQPHLRKCFEAIESLDFSPNLEITAMNSKEKEKVPFDEPMSPTGSVEQWLGVVEKRMRSSVRQQIINSLKDAAVSERPQWARSWPAMVVLAVSAIVWSKEVEDAIKGASVPKYFEKNNNDLLGLTDLVRGNLSTQDRLTLGALITTDVHARDTVQELVDCNIQRTTDFEWISRMRMYWRDDVYVDMVQASIPYGYEYLGNTPRLVITPLTDRCYMTLMSAMHLNLGGAPAGPAGTGVSGFVHVCHAPLMCACAALVCHAPLMSAMRLNLVSAPAGPAGTGVFGFVYLPCWCMTLVSAMHVNFGGASAGPAGTETVLGFVHH
ncbi:dynein heavy chain, N-terminal region 2-domain-containing protein [Dunaliella salina]|uniref:Dynein heavy chain, N-terminal region 2-domain-containing protein n=1 Tax=Dunaliella salina TaxID=3046 RepID=A0ABQ7G557_DUNSA|nr:dynein heavy chain, N-terminal region 2-domain-containing protein [Dunaliella salina]|eukprot:KAF5829735.1 dynein heavy chain, N-terminal region 2-domain-containing protein [Dunaliella salina]